VQITEPGEWRVRQMIDAWRESLDVRVRVLPDTRFVCPCPISSNGPPGASSGAWSISIATCAARPAC
jgi:hypothetical protein